MMTSCDVKPLKKERSGAEMCLKGRSLFGWKELKASRGKLGDGDISPFTTWCCIWKLRLCETDVYWQTVNLEEWV